MIRWLQRLWWRRQRAIDLNILWPACKDLAGDLESARRAFLVHARNDQAWIGEYGGKLEEVVRALQ